MQCECFCSHKSLEGVSESNGPLLDEMNTISGDRVIIIMIFSLTFIYLTELILISANK